VVAKQIAFHFIFRY